MLDATKKKPVTTPVSGEPLSTRQHLFRSLVTSGPGVAWLLFFMLVPLLSILVISCLSRGPEGQPALPVTVENYRRFFGFGLLGYDPLYPMVILRSLLLGAVTALACILMGFPLAFFIAALPRPSRQIALTLVVIPLWINLLIRTYAWQILLAPGGMITRIAATLGLCSPEAALYPGNFAIYAGMVCDFLPFLVLPLYSSAQKLDWSLVEAARDLGAPRWAVFRHAILPQVMPGLVAGTLLVFIPATGQFVVPDLLGGSKTLLLGNAIQQEFGNSRDWGFGSAITVLALVLVTAGLWCYARVARANGEPELL
jgi:spermidine/putrescine transport system permease protein